MYSTCKMLVSIGALVAFASASGPVIELPSDYNRISPWKSLAALELTKLKETDCQRTCTVGDPPRVCLHTFLLEYYSTMSAACGNCSKGVLKDCFRSQCIPTDGYERGVMSVNRMIPGPTIRVCKHDLLVVNVMNKMEGAVTTIHWHGLRQMHSQWMDGVPYMTQCPFGERFRYVIPMEEAGTYFWHSHTGLHRANGIYGALIVDEPRSEELWSPCIYDLDLPEHVMVVSDWMHYTAEMFYPGLPTLAPGIRPATVIINGVGIYLNGSDAESSFKQARPITTFHVKRDQRYRFRIINANSLICPMLIQIEDHNMTLIATDGKPVEPVVIDGLITYTGERYDVIIETYNAKNGKNAFWIHFRGLGRCELVYKLDQYAVLSYDTVVGDLGIIPPGLRPTMANPLPVRTIVNHPNTTCGVSPSELCISDLKSIGHLEDADVLTAQPDVRLFIRFGFHDYTDIQSFFQADNYKRFETVGGQSIRSATMNNISFTFPSTPSLFSWDSVDPEFCNQNNLPVECRGNDVDSRTPYCECPQIVTLKKNSIVEMTFIDDVDEISGENHPIHLHGYHFYVAWMGQDLRKSARYTKKKVKEILSEISRKPSNMSAILPGLKDTISVPAKGFVTVRFRADNPGDWLMHCHIEWHGHIGMMMAFRVPGNVAPKPPGFPTCRHFDPLLHHNVDNEEYY